MTETYRDQVTVTFRQIERLTEPRALDTVEIVISPHGYIDLEWLNAELEAIFRSRDDGGQRVKTSFQLRQHRTDVHWGAAGATASFLIETAAHIGSVGVDTTIGIAIGALIENLRQRGYTVRHGKAQPLTDDDVARHGLSAIETRFEVGLSDLTLRSTGSTTNHEYTVSAVGPDSSTYSVGFVKQGGETVVRTFERLLPPAN